MKSLLIILLVTGLASSGLGAQTILATNMISVGGSGGSDRTVVKDPSGLLHAVAVSEDASGNRPLLVLTSSDGGATWSTAPNPLNDANSGLSGANATNWCAAAIDSFGLIHCTFGGYFYPSYYQQYYCSYDPIAGTRSPILNVTALVGANNLVRIASQDILVDGTDTVWMISQGTSGSWREHLLRSTAPQAAGQTFQNLGPISSSASAQSTRLAVDASGLVHTSYYRNIGAGEYYHRIFDPVAGAWQAETRLGNTTPTNDFYGQLCADALGNVHALYVVDAHTTTPWGFRYRRYDPVSLWGPEVIVDDLAPAVYTGVANYRIYGIACEESTGLVYLVYRDLNNGGGSLMLFTKDLASPNFTPVGQIAPPTTALHGYIYPAIRGSLYPLSNQTGTELHLTWGQPGTATAWEWVFLGLGGGPPSGPTLAYTAPPTVGTVTTLDLESATDPNGLYLCGFSTAAAPGIPLPGGGVVALAYDALLALSLTPNNGIFFNNFGVLDPSGRASVVVSVPAVPSLAGIVIYSAFVVEDPQIPGTIGTISQTIPAMIQ